MNVGSSLPLEEPATVFYIGQHEALRTAPLSTGLISASQDLGYDFLTTPITSPNFQEKVVSLVTEHLDSIQTSTGASSTTLPSLQPFTPEDTCITPDDGNTSLVAIASPWIDLGSTDPLIRHVSRQVLNAELAYAAFCGISNILIFGPLPDSDVIQYARAVYEGLGLGPYMNLHVLLPVTGELEQDHVDGVHLSDLANGTNDFDSEELEEAFGVWDVWNTIRTTCNYSNKLSIGKTRHCINTRFIYISCGGIQPKTSCRKTPRTRSPLTSNFVQHSNFLASFHQSAFSPDGCRNLYEYWHSQGRPSYGMPKAIPYCPNNINSSFPAFLALDSPRGCCCVTLNQFRQHRMALRPPNQRPQRPLLLQRTSRKIQHHIYDTCATSKKDNLLARQWSDSVRVTKITCNHHFSH